MAHFLCLETSGDICSVCISRDLQILSDLHSPRDFSHTQHITIYIERCLEMASLSLKDINCVVISRGPGSYTGLRVAASAAKALCFSLDIPMISIDSLSALAYSAGDVMEGKHIVPLIDARNNNAYTAVFDADRNILREISFEKLSEDFVKDFEGDYLFVGSGAKTLKDNGWYGNSDFIMEEERASNLIVPAFHKFQKQDFENYKIFSPFYLNNPNITSSKKQLI
jgi:tRNA threonylcarbamoyladenosine biosynthesis protein TsaB